MFQGKRIIRINVSVHTLFLDLRNGAFKMLAMLLENQRGVKDALLYNYFPFNSFGHCIKILQDIS